MCKRHSSGSNVIDSSSPHGQPATHSQTDERGAAGPHECQEMTSPGTERICNRRLSNAQPLTCVFTRRSSSHIGSGLDEGRNPRHPTVLRAPCIDRFNIRCMLNGQCASEWLVCLTRAGDNQYTASKRFRLYTHLVSDGFAVEVQQGVSANADMIDAQRLYRAGARRASDSCRVLFN